MSLAKIPQIIFSPNYDIHFWGVEKMHPFDSQKYGKAWNRLVKDVGQIIVDQTRTPIRKASHAELCTVHTEGYLATLQHSPTVAKALELPFLSWLPYPLVETRVIDPMLWATKGTLMATQIALEENTAVVNMGGGYHHASANKGEGFCIFSDIGMAVEQLRFTGQIDDDHQALVIDLDAHQGNGYARIFERRKDVYLFDMFNSSIYPQDKVAEERVDYPIKITTRCHDDAYMYLLETHLPKALQAVKNPPIAFYLAGNDIYEGDLLGQMDVSVHGVYARDKFVFDTFKEAGIPLVTTLAGGYGKHSYELIARSIGYLFR